MGASHIPAELSFHWTDVCCAGDMPEKKNASLQTSKRRHPVESSSAVCFHFAAWLIATVALLLIHDEPTKMALVVGIYLEFRRTTSGVRRDLIGKIMNR